LTGTRHFSPATATLFATAIVILALAIIEVSARLYLAIRSGSAPKVDLHAYWVEDSDAGYALKPGYSAGGIRINSLGFRGPEISRERADSVARIATIGDSTTFGPREDECAYPYLLQDLLQPRQFEVVNAGVEGYRGDRALVHLQRDVVPLHPDLVTVFIGWDDLYQTNPFADSQQLALQTSPLQQVLSWSSTAQAFRQLYYQHLASHIELGAADDSVRLALVQSYRPQAFADRLHRIVQAARDGCADVVVFTWPTVLGPDMSTAELDRVIYPYYTHSLEELKALYVDYQTTVRQVAADDHVPVIDVAAWFDGANKADLFVDALHFTCAGHAVVAYHLAPLIAARLDSHRE
jgi:lysophospholipase L1-like esterase